MKQALLRDLLTETEIQNIRATTALAGMLDGHIPWLRVMDLSKIYSCLDNPTGMVPAGAISAHCINELTDRAIKKNLSIY